MGIFIEFLILAILIMILITLLIDEKRLKLEKSPAGKMLEYWPYGKERRCSIRVSTILSTKYSVETNNKYTIINNIGNGGILMQSNEKLIPSTCLCLDIILPNRKKPISAKGEVIWVKELPHTDEMGKRLFDAGIKFLSMNNMDKDTLDRHIKDLC